MKKLLALALFLGLTISAFAGPTCSEWYVDGGDPDLYSGALGYVTGTETLPPTVEFYCKVDGIEPGDTHYLSFFSWQLTPIGEKSSSLRGHFDKKSYTSMIKMYKHLEATEQDKDKLAKYTTIRENLESDLEANFGKGKYTFYKIWEPKDSDTILPEGFYGDWPARVTSADNGKEFKVRWQGGYGNQYNSSDLVPLNAFSFIGFCTEKYNLETCTGLYDPFYEHFINYIGAYGTPDEDDDHYYNITSPTIKIPYGYSGDLEDGMSVQVDMYIIDSEFNFYNLSPYHVRLDNLHEIIANQGYYVKYIPLDTKQPLEPQDTVPYIEVGDIPAGSYIIVVRYKLLPDLLTTINGVYSMTFVIKGLGEYNPQQGIEELEIKKLVNSANKVSFEIDKGQSGICNIYDVAGRVIKTIPFTEKFEHNKTEKNGVYLYNVRSEDGKSTTIKTIGK